MRPKSINRRDFIRLSTTASASVAITSSWQASASNIPQQSEPSKSIPMRPLGKTGITLPILSMGVDRPDSSNVLRAAFNAGITHFDTANGYQRGRNEEQLGSLFDGQPRDSRFIATKIMYPYPLRENFEADFEEKLETSLKRLRVDQVDLLYLHDIRTVENVKDPRVMAALKKAKTSGKARFIGLSFHNQDPDIFNTAIDMGIYEVLLLSYNFKMKNREANEAAIERAAKAGIGLIGMKTMAGGTEDAQGVKQINGRACLKWVWQNKHITTVIPGLTNYEHLNECLEAAYDPEISKEEKQYLAALGNQEMLYCQQCNTCTGQCPQQLPIPDIMRAYMYAFGHKNASKSKETLVAMNLPADACSQCKTCHVQCPSGFDVAKKIAAITPVLQAPDVFLT